MKKLNCPGGEITGLRRNGDDVWCGWADNHQHCPMCGWTRLWRDDMDDPRKQFMFWAKLGAMVLIVLAAAWGLAHV